MGNAASAPIHIPATPEEAWARCEALLDRYHDASINRTAYCAEEVASYFPPEGGMVTPMPTSLAPTFAPIPTAPLPAGPSDRDISLATIESWLKTSVFSLFGFSAIWFIYKVVNCIRRRHQVARAELKVRWANGEAVIVGKMPRDFNGNPVAEGRDGHLVPNEGWASSQRPLLASDMASVVSSAISASIAGTTKSLSLSSRPHSMVGFGGSAGHLAVIEEEAEATPKEEEEEEDVK